MRAKRLRKVEPKGDDQSTCVVGIDPSLAGSAVSWFLNGRLWGFQGWTSIKKLHTQHPTVLCYHKLPAHATRGQRQARIDYVASWLLLAVTVARQWASKVYVAIEDYAMGQRDQRGHLDLAELVGSVKVMLWKASIPVRLYEPTLIKLAWTGDGSAEKEDMLNACRREFLDLRKYQASEKNPSPADNLADAILIGALLQRELDIRAGRLPLEKVNERIRAVMLRVTKTHPEAPISRPFIWAGGVEMPQPVLARRA